MIKACPICGTDYGLTHGDQTFIRQVCEECTADTELMKWWKEKTHATA